MHVGLFGLFVRQDLLRTLRPLDYWFLFYLDRINPSTICRSYGAGWILQPRLNGQLAGFNGVKIILFFILKNPIASYRESSTVGKLAIFRFAR